MVVNSKEASGIFPDGTPFNALTPRCRFAADHLAGAPEPADLFGGTGTRAEQRRNHV